MIIFFVTNVKILGFPPPLQPSDISKKLEVSQLGVTRTADTFPVVASLPPKIALFFGGREATTGNVSAVRRLAWGYAHRLQLKTLCVFPEWMTLGAFHSPLNLQHFVQVIIITYITIIATTITVSVINDNYKKKKK